MVEWVDRHDRVIAVVTRRRVRAENLRHRSVAIAVLDSAGRLVVHRRSDTKDLAPGWWDICAGGVIGVGESAHDAAVRELAEELGIEDAALEPLGTEHYDGSMSREICHVFLTFHDGPYRFVDGEITEVRRVGPGELIELASVERFAPGSIEIVLPHLDGFEPPPERPQPGDATPRDQ